MNWYRKAIKITPEKIKYWIDNSTNNDIKPEYLDEWKDKLPNMPFRHDYSKLGDSDVYAHIIFWNDVNIVLYIYNTGWTQVVCI